jgi:Ca2+-binding RTX toxin-like protein
MGSMNNTSVNNDDARFAGISVAMLAATLVAVLAVFVLAKPSGAQDTTVTIEPTEVGFGAVEVNAEAEKRTISITNTGDTTLRIGGVDFSGTDADDFDLVTAIHPLKGLRVGVGDTVTLVVSFDPLTTGAKEATLILNDLLGQTIPGAPQVNITGTGISTAPNDQPGARPDCDITGTPNGEVLTGTPNSEVICGLGGNDRVSALGGNDKVRGDRGNDVVRSSKGIDTLIGGAGADRITDKASRRGGDKLFGQRGRDTLNAKDGRRSDVLNGGPQRDRAFKDRGDRVRNI